MRLVVVHRVHENIETKSLSLDFHEDHKYCYACFHELSCDTNFEHLQQPHFQWVPVAK
jgi:hypothetical protein